MAGKRPNRNVEVVILAGMNGKACAAPDRKKIVKIVRDTLLRNAREPYHKVQVEVECGPDGKPTALLASMLRARTYTADIVRVLMDADGKAKSVERLTP